MDNTKEESWLYFWDGASLAYNDRMSLPFKDINAIIQSEVKIIQYGSDGQFISSGIPQDSLLRISRRWAR